MYCLREHLGQRSIVAEWYLESGVQVNAMQNLCQSYLAPGMQMTTLEQLYTQCHQDFNGLYRVLKVMENIMDPGHLPGHAEYMQPMYVLMGQMRAQSKIPRMISILDEDARVIASRL